MNNIKKSFYPYLIFIPFGILCLIIYLVIFPTAIAQRGVRMLIIGSDFRAFYMGGRMVAEQSTNNFYSISKQYASQKEFVKELSHQKRLMPFVYPPFVALPFSLLALFPLETAYFIWSAINILLVLVVCFVISLVFDKEKFFLKVAALFFVTLFPPLWTTIIQGQLSILLALFLLISYYEFQKGKDLMGGFALSFLLMRPYLVLLPLLVLIVHKRIKALFGFFFGFILLGALSLLLVGWEGIGGYVHLLRDAMRWEDVYTIHPQFMHTWRGFLHHLFATDKLSDILFPWILGSVLAILMLLWGWRGKWSPKLPNFSLKYSLLIMSMLFVSPHTNFHDLTLWILPAVLGFKYLARSTFSSFKYALLMFLILLGYIVTLTTVDVSSLSRIQLSVVFMMLVILILVAIISNKRATYKNSSYSHSGR